MLTIDSSEYLLETLLEAFRRPTIAQDSKPGNWPSTYTEITYPVNLDPLWGLTVNDWTPDILNRVEFGVGFQIQVNNVPTLNPQLQCVKVIVEYSLPVPTTGPITSGYDIPTGGNIASTTGSGGNFPGPSGTIDKGNLPIPIIGGVIGGVVLLLIVIAILVVLLRKKRKDSDNSYESKKIPLRGSLLLAEGNYSTPEYFRQPTTREEIPKLSNIEIRDKLGSGKFGEVFMGMWNHTTPVALKRILSDSDSFEKELQILCSLGNHPHIVQFLGIFEVKDGTRYIVMEFVGKGSVKQFLQSPEGQQLNEKELLQIMMGICSGMAYLEKKKVVHRDLSARNCLLSITDGRLVAKVSDFGLSREIEDEYTVSKTSDIPVRWTAPEALKLGSFTTASDVWSFGVVCWEIFAGGAVPYDWLTNKQVSEEVPKGERLSKPLKCDKRIWKLIESCWTVDPKDRPTFLELCQKFQKLLPEVVPDSSNFVSNKDDNYMIDVNYN